MKSLGFDYSTSQDFYSAIPDDMLGDNVPDLLQDMKQALNKFGLFETEDDILSYIEKRDKAIELGVDLEPHGDFVIFHLSEVLELI